MVYHLRVTDLPQGYLIREYKRHPEAFEAYKELDPDRQLIIDDCVRTLVEKIGHHMGPSSAFILLYKMGRAFKEKGMCLTGDTIGV